MKDNANKIPYAPPILEVLEYAVEQGFALTSIQSMTETMSQINDDYMHHHHSSRDAEGCDSYDNDWHRENFDAGQNYHGEWY